MPIEKFKFKSVASSQARIGVVSFALERTNGNAFEVLLNVDDARRLCDGLSKQIEIAKKA